MKLDIATLKYPLQSVEKLIDIEIECSHWGWVKCWSRILDLATHHNPSVAEFARTANSWLPGSSVLNDDLIVQDVCDNSEELQFLVDVSGECKMEIQICQLGRKEMWWGAYRIVDAWVSNTYLGSVSLSCTCWNPPRVPHGCLYLRLICQPCKTETTNQLIDSVRRPVERISYDAANDSYSTKTVRHCTLKLRLVQSYLQAPYLEEVEFRITQGIPGSCSMFSWFFLPVCFEPFAKCMCDFFSLISTQSQGFTMQFSSAHVRGLFYMYTVYCILLYTIGKCLYYIYYIHLYTNLPRSNPTLKGCRLLPNFHGMFTGFVRIIQYISDESQVITIPYHIHRIHQTSSNHMAKKKKM